MPYLALRARAARVGGLAASTAIAAVFGALYGWALHLRHARFDTYAFDLGLLTQVAWNSLHGRWFDTTVLPFNYLAEHFSPALVLASPLLLVWPDAEALLALQVVAVAGAGVGVYLAARRCAGDGVAALLVQLAYHLAPTTAWVALDEFHPVSLALPAVAFASALLWRGRTRAAAGVAALALLANEDAALWVAPFGLLVAAVGLRRKRGALWGAALALVAAAWLAAYMLLIAPAVRPAELGETVPHPDLGAFSQCGSSLSAIAWCLVRDPAATLRRATTPDDLAGLAAVFGPTAGLGLLGPSALVAGARWLVMLLGNDPPNFRAHYAALLVPAAYLAAGEAVGWLSRGARGRARLLAVFVAGPSLAAYVLASPLPGGAEYRPYPRFDAERVAALDEAVDLIPADPDLGVAATSSLLPHLALRERIYLIFGGREPAPDYYVLDLRDPYPIQEDELRRHAALLRVNPRYQPIYDQDDLLVLERGFEPPQRRAKAVFGGDVRLVGYGVTAEDGEARLLLFWRTERPVPLDLHYFVHLVDVAGKGFSQQDGVLAEGNLPSANWNPGQWIRDEVTLPVPPQVDWAKYHLEVGWYDLATGARLKLPDGADHVDLLLVGG